MLRAAPLLALAAAAFAACGAPTAITLPDLDGRVHQPTEPARGQVHVLVFTSHECPIANAYAPTLRTLASQWQGQPVRLFLIHVDPDLAAAAAAAHARDYELPGAILLDPRHQLATALGATRTPEAVVLSGAGLVYRGRIDDQWRELGARRPEASVHDLRAAVETALKGGVVPAPFPQAVGCLLPEPAR
ncbi:MAG TPA: redoxin domain-containing protein [Planctomycetota bacterium]